MCLKAPKISQFIQAITLLLELKNSGRLNLLPMQRILLIRASNIENSKNHVIVQSISKHLKWYYKIKVQHTAPKTLWRKKYFNNSEKCKSYFKDISSPHCYINFPRKQINISRVKKIRIFWLTVPPYVGPFSKSNGLKIKDPNQYICSRMQEDQN